MPSVHDLVVDELVQVRDHRGILSVAEFAEFVPFIVVRLFYVFQVPPGTVRGQHAHHRCRQYAICQQGRIQIDFFDGKDERQLTLSASQGILIEPKIFATETYLDPGSIMLVLCDRPFEKEDYIRTKDALVTLTAKSG